MKNMEWALSAYWFRAPGGASENKTGPFYIFFVFRDSSKAIKDEHTSTIQKPNYVAAPKRAAGFTAHAARPCGVGVIQSIICL